MIKKYSHFIKENLGFELESTEMNTEFDTLFEGYFIRVTDKSFQHGWEIFKSTAIDYNHWKLKTAHPTQERNLNSLKFYKTKSGADKMASKLNELVQNRKLSPEKRLAPHQKLLGDQRPFKENYINLEEGLFETVHVSEILTTEFKFSSLNNIYVSPIPKGDVDEDTHSSLEEIKSYSIKELQEKISDLQQSMKEIENIGYEDLNINGQKFFDSKKLNNLGD